MASKCSKCLQKKKSSIPAVWCYDCQELLCQSCVGNHKLSTSSKNHHSIPFEDYQKLPPFILSIKNYCDKHKEKLTHFCRIHDEPICLTCHQTLHKKCEDVPKIEDFVQNVKASALFEDIWTEMKTVFGTLQKISANRSENSKQLKHMRQEMEKNFEKKIESMINHLNKLKAKTMSNIESVYNKLTKDMSHTSQIAQSKGKKLHDILTQRDAIQNYASNYKTFIGIKEMEEIVQETNKTIQSMEENHKLQQTEITFDINETIEKTILGIQLLRDVKVTTTPSTVMIPLIKPMEAQKEVHTHGQVQLYNQRKINLDKEGWYSDCCSLPNVLLVLTSDSFNHLLIYNTDGSQRSTIELKESAIGHNVTPLDDHHVVVSHHDSPIITIIDVDSDKVVKTLNIGEEVRGLCCKERDLVCCVPNKGLKKVNLDSEIAETVVNDENVGYCSHIKASKDLFCYTCPLADTVTVLDSQYNVIFRYKSVGLFFSPWGVAIDDRSNIYVTGYDSSNLVVIPTDGSSCYQLLGEDDGLKNPMGVYYDRGTKKLVVVNVNGPAFVYSVR